MGDMGELFEFYGVIKKKQRVKRNARLEPLCQDIGAVCKSSGVYQYGNWFLYPTKGFAMNRFDYTKRRLIDLIEEIREKVNGKDNQINC